MAGEQKKFNDPLTNSDVDFLTKEIIRSSNKDGYLDHTIRAVENYVIEKWKQKNFYKISKRIVKNSQFKEGQGFVYIFNYGAIIKYSDKGNGVDRRFAIAHELGHILLHYKHDSEVSGASNVDFKKDKIKETQASYFAKMVLNDRSDLRIRRNDILPLDDKAVKRYCGLYDEKLMESEEMI